MLKYNFCSRTLKHSHTTYDEKLSLSQVPKEKVITKLYKTPTKFKTPKTNKRYQTEEGS